MYKNIIINALLTLVMVFSMTACSVSDTPSATSATTAPTTSDTTVERATIVIDISEATVNFDEYWTMTPEEFSVALDELVQISESEDLSSEDMSNLASHFLKLLFYKHSDSSEDEFMTKSYEAFNNVYTLCLAQQIPLEDLYSWTSLPVVDIQVKYFSSENFASPNELDCAFYLMIQDDANKVAKAVFDNPVFADNYWFAYSAIDYPDPKVEEMGWNHLMELAKNATPQTSEQVKQWAQEMSKYDYYADKAAELLEALES